MAQIRFLSPAVPQLVIADLEIRFVDGVLDLDDTDPRVSQLRYRGAPYGVVEMGVTSLNSTNPWPTLDTISEVIADPTSDLGAQLRALFATGASVTGVAANVAALTARVDGLGSGGGGGGGSSSGAIRTGLGVTGSDYDASSLIDGTLVALKSSDNDLGA